MDVILDWLNDLVSDREWERGNLPVASSRPLYVVGQEEAEDGEGKEGTHN